MKKLQSISIIITIMFMSCQGIVEGINDNPNEITPGDVEAELFLTGAMLANSVAQGGHLNRISGMYSGHLIGFQSLYSNIYGYNLTTAESGSTWSHYYVGAVTNLRHIRDVKPDDKLLAGISKVLEAHAMGTAASLFGDIPYSEINDLDVPNPVFDSQSSVFLDLITLLDEAKSDLTSDVSRTLSQDIYFEGDADKWREAAATLQARYYLQLKNYDMALTAAASGVSSDDGNMQFIPRGNAEQFDGDKNLFFEVLSGSRQGDIGTGNSYLIQLLEAGGSVDRNNAKTDEYARFGYYSIDESSAVANKGIAEQFEPQDLVSYGENLLIQAECAGRSGGLAAGLPFLNEWRQFMNTGGHVNENFSDSTYLYLDYDAADFASGGIENPDGIAADRAFLREVVEERYVAGFRMYMAFNDIRRLAKSDADLMVPFPLNTTTATQQPQRLPYSDDELNTNTSAPLDPGIFATTEVNQ